MKEKRSSSEGPVSQLAESSDSSSNVFRRSFFGRFDVVDERFEESRFVSVDVTDTGSPACIRRFVFLSWFDDEGRCDSRDRARMGAKNGSVSSVAWREKFEVMSNFIPKEWMQGLLICKEVGCDGCFRGDLLGVSASLSLGEFDGGELCMRFCPVPSHARKR